MSGASKHLDRGDGLFDDGETELALAEYDKALEAEPESTLALAKKANALHSLSRLDEALETLDRLIGLDPNDPWAFAKRGEVHANRRDFPAAIAEYDKAIEVDAGYKSAWASKGGALNAIARYDEALEALDRAIELDPAYVWALNKRGEVHANRGDFEAAIKDYDRAVEVDPRYQTSWASKGGSLNALGRYDEALEALDRALEIDPRDAWSYTKRGAVHANRGDFEAAIEDYDRAIEVDPDHQKAWANKGGSLNALRRYDEALEALDQTITLDPDYTWALNKRGEVHANRGDFARAIEDYDRAIETDPDFQSAWASKGGSLTALRRYDEALEVLDRALEIDPRDAWSYTKRGEVYANRGEFAKAIEDYDRAIAVDANYHIAWGSKGQTLSAMGSPKEALAALDRALEIDPDYAWGHVARGDVLVGQEKYDQALAAYDRAHEVDPELAEALIGRSEALGRLDRLDDALHAIDKALELAPDSGWAYRKRAEIWRLRQQPEKARSDLARARNVAQEDPGLFLSLGHSYADLGEIEEASEHYRISAQLLEASGNKRWERLAQGYFYSMLAVAEPQLAVDHYERAQAEAQAALELAEASGEKSDIGAMAEFWKGLSLAHRAQVSTDWETQRASYTAAIEAIKSASEQTTDSSDRDKFRAQAQLFRGILSYLSASSPEAGPDPEALLSVALENFAKYLSSKGVKQTGSIFVAGGGVEGGRALVDHLQRWGRVVEPLEVPTLLGNGDLPEDLSRLEGSDVVLADTTGGPDWRTGVQLGYALGLGKQTILAGAQEKAELSLPGASRFTDLGESGRFAILESVIRAVNIQLTNARLFPVVSISADRSVLTGTRRVERGLASESRTSLQEGTDQATQQTEAGSGRESTPDRSR